MWQVTDSKNKTLRFTPRTWPNLHKLPLLKTYNTGKAFFWKKHFTAEDFLEMGSGVMDFIDLSIGCLMLSSTLFIYSKTPWWSLMCFFAFLCFFFWITQARWGTPVSYIKRWAESRTCFFSSDQQRQVAQRAGRWVWEAQQRNIPAVFLHFLGLPSGKRHDEKFFPCNFQIFHTRNERTPLFVF